VSWKELLTYRLKTVSFTYLYALTHVVLLIDLVYRKAIDVF